MALLTMALLTMALLTMALLTHRQVPAWLGLGFGLAGELVRADPSATPNRDTPVGIGRLQDHRRPRAVPLYPAQVRSLVVTPAMASIASASCSASRACSRPMAPLIMALLTMDLLTMALLVLALALLATAQLLSRVLSPYGSTYCGCT